MTAELEQVGHAFIMIVTRVKVGPPVGVALLVEGLVTTDVTLLARVVARPVVAIVVV